MSTGFVTKSKIPKYNFITSIFRGPLDLLLSLIERAELDITLVSLAQVTDQYMAHLALVQERDPEEVSAFLVIATRLLQIKSEVLLPKTTHQDIDEEDIGDDLVHQLQIYKVFKESAEFFGERQAAGQRGYLRISPISRFDVKPDLGEVTLDDLANLFRASLDATDEGQPLGSVIATSRVTIREKISMITRRLWQQGRCSFYKLLNGQVRREDIVVTFLAVLELIKIKMVVVKQEVIFGDIEIFPGEMYGDEGNEYELEFGE